MKVKFSFGVLFLRNQMKFSDDNDEVSRDKSQVICESSFSIIRAVVQELQQDEVQQVRNSHTSAFFSRSDRPVKPYISGTTGSIRVVFCVYSL